MGNLQHRRVHRKQVLDRISRCFLNDLFYRLAQDTLYDKACIWCPEFFPDRPPNMIKVQLPESDGMCKECYRKMMNDAGLSD